MCTSQMSSRKELPQAGANRVIIFISCLVATGLERIWLLIAGLQCYGLHVLCRPSSDGDAVVHVHQRTDGGFAAAQLEYGYTNEAFTRSFVRKVAERPGTCAKETPKVCTLFCRGASTAPRHWRPGLVGSGGPLRTSFEGIVGSPSGLVAFGEVFQIVASSALC